MSGVEICRYCTSSTVPAFVVRQVLQVDDTTCGVAIIFSCICSPIIFWASSSVFFPMYNRYDTGRPGPLWSLSFFFSSNLCTQLVTSSDYYDQVSYFLPFLFAHLASSLPSLPFHPLSTLNVVLPKENVLAQLVHPFVFFFFSPSLFSCNFFAGLNQPPASPSLKLFCFLSSIVQPTHPRPTFLFHRASLTLTNDHFPVTWLLDWHF